MRTNCEVTATNVVVARRARSRANTMPYAQLGDRSRGSLLGAAAVVPRAVVGRTGVSVLNCSCVRLDRARFPLRSGCVQLPFVACHARVLTRSAPEGVDCYCTSCCTNVVDNASKLYSECLFLVSATTTTTLCTGYGPIAFCDQNSTKKEACGNCGACTHRDIVL